MRSNRLATTAWLGLLVWSGAALAACGVDVELGFPPDDTCTAKDGRTIADGETFPDEDGCNTCTCSQGELVCTGLACDPCPLELMPGCADMPVGDPSCYREAQCGPGGWICVDTCPCANATFPECPVLPNGCYQEPICDGETWSCGPPVCPTCDETPICDPPQNPLCFVEPTCDEMQLVWVCDEVCPDCPGPEPSCGFSTTATCQPEGWTCGTSTCGTEVAFCAASKLPLCENFMECGEVGWTCQESCDPAAGYCTDPAPPCEEMIGPPNCFFYSVCTSQGWQCVESCF